MNFLQEFWQPSWQLHQQQRLFEVHTATTKGQRSTVVFCVYVYKTSCLTSVIVKNAEFSSQIIYQTIPVMESLGSRLYEGLRTIVG